MHGRWSCPPTCCPEVSRGACFEPRIFKSIECGLFVPARYPDVPMMKEVGSRNPVQVPVAWRNQDECAHRDPSIKRNYSPGRHLHAAARRSFPKHAKVGRAVNINVAQVGVDAMPSVPSLLQPLEPKNARDDHLACRNIGRGDSKVRNMIRWRLIMNNRVEWKTTSNLTSNAKNADRRAE